MYRNKYIGTNFTFQVISIVFIIVASTSLAFESNLFNVYEDNNHYGQGYGWGDTYVKKFYAVVDFIGPPIILTIGLVCFGFTIALIIGTHMVIILYFCNRPCHW